MSDTYDTGTEDIDSLPPVTKALRLTWNPRLGRANAVQAGLEPVANPVAMRAVLDAVHALENRIAALETP